MIEWTRLDSCVSLLCDCVSHLLFYTRFVEFLIILLFIGTITVHFGVPLPLIMNIFNFSFLISPFAISGYEALWVISRRSPEDKLEEDNVHLQSGELRRFNKNVFYLTFVDCLILIPTLYHCTCK